MKDQRYQLIRGQDGKPTIAGFGSYGQVKLAKNIQTGETVAIKMIYNKNAKEQIDVHHKLNHPNIIKLINYYYDKEKNVTYMVLEYAENGTLSQRIKFGLGQLSKNLIRKIFKDVCEAIQYVHTNNYMHRDIKPQNILLTKENHAKLCDFGFAAILEYRSTLCGTYEYMSPEMIQKKPYDYKIDVWALGILLFEMINGTAPFRGESAEQVLTEMKKPIVFSNRFEPQEIDLIRKILRVNAENRPKLETILDHPYFKMGTQKTIISNGEEEGFKKRSTHKNEIKVQIQPQQQQEQLTNIQKQFKPYVPQQISNSKNTIRNYPQNPIGNTINPYNNSFSQPMTTINQPNMYNNTSLRYNNPTIQPQNNNYIPPNQQYKPQINYQPIKNSTNYPPVNTYQQYGWKK